MNRHPRAVVAGYGLLLVCVIAPPATGEQEAKTPERAATQFVQVIHDADGQPDGLQTAILHLTGEHPQGGRLEVDLVAAIHVADAGYYEELNRRFKGYDEVLYELVAPEGTRIPRGGPGASSHPVGMAQQGLTSLLDLAFQLDSIDYTPENFRHADLSPAEFAASMEAKDESFMKMLLRVMGQAMAIQAKQPSKMNDFRLLGALFSDDRALQLKRIMADQMTDMEELVQAFEGAEGSTLVSERNKRAVEVLQRQIHEGHHRLAIFYGAAHMPDMARRVLAELDVQPAGKSWLTAWDLRDSR